MLDRTFVHIPGIGRSTERRLWDFGIRTWMDLPKLPSSAVAERLAQKLRLYVPLSQEALASRNTSFFSRLFQMGEAWRLYDALSDNCVYFDVETTGLSPIFNTITVAGLYDGKEYRVFVDGQNLRELPEALGKYDAIVTFNGAQFDLRFLRTAFEAAKVPPVHIDLRWAVRKAGYSGTLKSVEERFGLRRPPHLAEITSADAPILWSKHLRGDSQALDLLVQYNAQDVVNLKAIMERTYIELSRSAGFKLAAKPSRVLGTSVVASSSKAYKNSKVIWANENVALKLLEKVEAGSAKSRIIGIDLTGSDRRPSGWALLDGRDVITELIATDDEIVERTIEARPTLVSIDSPLSLPGGVFSVKQWAKRRRLPIYRQCELALKRMGISVFWCLLPTMAGLTQRGIKLAKTLRHHGIEVIESYPGAAQDILRIPRKGASLEELRWGLHGLGLRGPFLSRRASHDEIDAITSALVGLFYVADEYIALGNERENYLIIPSSACTNLSVLSEILAKTGLDPLPVQATMATA